MAHIRIDWSASARPTLSATVLSAVLLASPAVQEEFAKVIRRSDVWWNTSDTSNPSFQGTSVLHGTTSATTSAFGNASAESDPWQDLQALGPDWDGSGAEPVSHDALEHATKFLESSPMLSSAFEPFAHPNGSVGLEGHKLGKSAYLVVSPKDRFAYVLRVGETVHRGNDVAPSAMRRVLELLF